MVAAGSSLSEVARQMTAQRRPDRRGRLPLVRVDSSERVVVARERSTGWAVSMTRPTI